MILFFLLACDPTVADELGAHGDVPWSCTFAFTHDTGTEEGVFEEGVMSCDDYKEHGEQLVGSKQGACEQEGADSGATEVVCECTIDRPDTCTGAVND